MEQIFGVLKCCFNILIHPPEYNLDVQSRVPAGLAAIHNFIRRHDPTDFNDYLDVHEDPQPGVPANLGDLATGIPRQAERNRSTARRAEIAGEMWAQYQQELQRRGDI